MRAVLSLHHCKCGAVKQLVSTDYRAPGYAQYLLLADELKIVVMSTTFLSLQSVAEI